MKNIKINSILAALIAAFVMGAPVGASAQESCFAVGETYAKQNGVSLVAAEEASDGGQSVCKIVVLQQASNGNRPKREVVILPR